MSTKQCITGSVLELELKFTVLVHSHCGVIGSLVGNSKSENTTKTQKTHKIQIKRDRNDRTMTGYQGQGAGETDSGTDMALAVSGKGSGQEADETLPDRGTGEASTDPGTGEVPLMQEHTGQKPRPQVEEL